MKLPYFEVDSKNVIILSEPSEYYNYLKTIFTEAKERILISSLYLGTGKLEKYLVEIIEKNLEQNKELKVKTLFDYSRGLRNKENSKTIFQNCFENFSDRFQMYLYHTPKLRDGLKKCLPERVDESIGVMHIKVYIADNNLLITGANLSQDYFVDRQDRYIVLKDCKKLCDFYSLIFDSIGEFSFKVTKNKELIFNNKNQDLHPYLGDYNEFCKQFAQRIYDVYEKSIKQRLDLSTLTSFDQLETNDTKAYIIPLIQNGLANVKYDENFINYILSKSQENAQLNLATGYFNLTENLINRIINSKSLLNILITSELGNGFYRSKGFSKYIPEFYTCIEKSFLNRVAQSEQETRIKLFEYYKKDWTFHAKGLWYIQNKKKDPLPTLTVVGSSNFGHRSVNRDLEFQLAIFSKNTKFKQMLLDEQTHVYENSTLVTYKDIQIRKASSWWVRIASKLIKPFL